MLSILRLLTLTGAALLSVATPAQVVRCTDARSGTITYTDGDCAPGSRAHEVQARQSAQDIAQERAQAAQALEHKQQRLQAEAAALQLQAQRQALHEREQAAQRQREIDWLGRQGSGEIEKNRPAAPPEVVYVPVPWPPQRPVHPHPPHFEAPRPLPQRFTHCNMFRCYDRQGRSYTRP